jgi:hypothetical protein
MPRITASRTLFLARALRLLGLAGVVLPVAAVRAASAQVAPVSASARPLASRAELSQVAAGEAAGGAARRRLVEGDFRPGDRLLLRLTGAMDFADTVVVRSGGSVTVGTLPPVDLTGVLRSEVRDSLDAKIARLVRGVSVVATPLVRIGLVGEVLRPGFYLVPADVALTEVVMQAGGLTPRADVNKARAHRAGAVVWSPSALRAAFAAGLTLDQLALGPGDTIELGERTTVNWSFVLQTVSLIPMLVIAANSLR